MSIGIKRGLVGVVPGNTEIYGSFLANGSSNPATTYADKGWTVVHTATGIWTVTITQPMNEFVYIAPPTVQVTSGNGDALLTYVGDVTSIAEGDSTNTFEICLKVAADTATAEPALADLAASTTVNRFHFRCVVSDSGLAGSK